MTLRAVAWASAHVVTHISPSSGCGAQEVADKQAAMLNGPEAFSGVQRAPAKIAAGVPGGLPRIQAISRGWRPNNIAACLVGCIVGMMDCSAQAAPPPPELMLAVFSHLDDDSSENSTAIAQRLRRFGTDALDRLLAVRSVLEAEQERADDLAARVASTRRIQRLDRLTDEVASQKWSGISALFWYRDLEDALQQARELNRPVLSLRVEGSLTEDIESAEVLMLLAGLYCNREIAEQLRNRFVLHWQADHSRSLQAGSLGLRHAASINEAPRPPASPHLVHYLLNPDGLPVAALTRCVSPGCFLNWFEDYTSLAGSTDCEADEFAAALRAAHNAARDRRLRLLEREIRKFDGDGTLRAVKLSSIAVSGEPLSSQMSPERWQRFKAALSREAYACELDVQSLALIQSDSFVEQVKSAIPIRLTPEVIQRRVTAETVRSQLVDMFVIDGWFCQSPNVLDFDLLNAKIYRSFFAVDPE